MNGTPFAQAAIDDACAHNVPVIASAADEHSYHHVGSGEVFLYAVHPEGNAHDGASVAAGHEPVGGGGIRRAGYAGITCVAGDA